MLHSSARLNQRNLQASLYLKRFQRTQPQRQLQGKHPVHPSQSSTSFIITPNVDFPTTEALLALEKDFPKLKVSNKITNKGDYIPTNPDSHHILKSTRVLSNGKTINLCLYSPPPKKTKMVLEGYLLEFPLGCLQEHPLIETASCLIVRPSKEETRLSLFWEIYPQSSNWVYSELSTSENITQNPLGVVSVNALITMSQNVGVWQCAESVLNPISENRKTNYCQVS